MQLRRSILVSLMALCLSNAVTVMAQDLSPIPGVGSSSQAATSESATSESVTSEAAALDVNINQPASLINALYASQSNVVTNLALFEAQQNGVAKGGAYADARDGQFHYLSTTNSTQMPYSALIELDSDGKTIKQAWQSLDDLMAFSAELMKLQASELVGTVVDQMMKYAKDHSATLIGKYVTAPDTTLASQLYATTSRWNQYFEVVLKDWMALHPHETVSENQQLRYELTGELASQFTQVMRQHEADFPELKATFEQFKAEYDGTIVLDFERQQIAIGLIEGEHRIEYYVRAKTVQLAAPAAQNILTPTQLTEQLGFDWFGGLDKVEKAIIP